MTRAPLVPNWSDVESLLAVERAILPEPDDVRKRVIERARASLMGDGLPLAAGSTGRQRVKIGVAAAAAVVLSALCAAAFFAGYRIRNPNVESPGKLAPPLPSIVVQRVASPSVVDAATPVAAPAGQVPANSANSLGVQPSKPSPSRGTKSAADIESYAKELRVLQPARQAVARQDFDLALSAIAQHQRLYPSGRLAEEREALRIRALLGLGRTAEAQRAGAAFHAHFPRSALLGRIDEMLGKQK